MIFTNSWNPKLKINGEEMYIKAFYSTGGSPDNIYFSTMIYLNKDDIVSVENKRMYGLQYYEI